MQFFLVVLRDFPKIIGALFGLVSYFMTPEIPPQTPNCPRCSDLMIRCWGAMVGCRESQVLGTRTWLAGDGRS